MTVIAKAICPVRKRTLAASRVEPVPGTIDSMSHDADEIATLRIELADIEPLIWRRVAVRTSTSLQTLHRVIQAVMGWLDSHLWEFDVDGARYGVPDAETTAWGYALKRASTIRLAKLLNQMPVTFGYTYDMGDNWKHRVVVEGVSAADPCVAYPMFLGGERRCPPEDCGSVVGYYGFLADIPGPDRGAGSRRKRDALRWYGRPYDPDDIDEDRIRSDLVRTAAAGRVASK